MSHQYRAGTRPSRPRDAVRTLARRAQWWLSRLGLHAEPPICTPAAPRCWASGGAQIW